MRTRTQGGNAVVWQVCVLKLLVLELDLELVVLSAQWLKVTMVR